MPLMTYRETDRIYDELLVTLVRGGDQRAATRLASRWYPRLLATARRQLGDGADVQDAVQETWVGICRGLPTLRDPTRFPAWAFGILHRKCVDRIRQRQAARATETGLDVAQVENPARGFDRVALDTAFAALSPDHRMAAALYFAGGLTLPEIALATNVPVGTAKSRLFHARRQLKLHLEGEDND